MKLSKFSKTGELNINSILLYLLYLKAIFFFTNQKSQMDSLFLLTLSIFLKSLCYWMLTYLLS